MDKYAAISDCGTYRYLLTRRWGGGPPVTWIMLNPSTADHEQDDPTIRRCINFTKAWGYNALQVVNLFAYRATSPKDMKSASAPIGPENKERVLAAIKASEGAPIICAWGANGKHRNQDDAMLRLLRNEGVTPMCLTKDKPKANHPLYLPADLTPTPL